ncbi:DNA polymerase Y family protein [Nitratireductor sp. ZSWI3]|uniref:DNA polymerase Y family protein n=1 Tax=Nitratireductor sp. ZSWI3 TaxID=2966359 RepID=UPI0021505A5C|nr:DNA polymerase Y family protein [Nitratireductor sp. ZSWI3]MCR4269391.1 DNA polymerase Y family protein [Nitratireductor sp. ZSWI3]
MKRFLSVFLPRWPIERRHGRMALPMSGRRPRDDEAPDRDAIVANRSERDAALVLVTTSDSGQHITALNASAERLGFSPGMALADARAIHPTLQVAHADLPGDERALLRLALWCQCFSPFTRADAPDGVSLDITGCAHLFGGEEKLLETLAERLARFGLTARLAIAPTLGAAWGLARHASTPRLIVERETLHRNLAPLPVAALRLEETTLSALDKLGLKHIGDLLGKPRAPLVARFGAFALRRLDEALGQEEESFCPLSPQVFHSVQYRFAEPVVTQDAVGVVIERLARDLCAELERAGKGARRVELRLFRVDGWFEALPLATSTATRDPRHLARLLSERLDRIEDRAGFGFEAASLGAFQVEPLAARQEDLENETSAATRGDVAPLLDRLVNRFGAQNVTRALPYESHVPERAFRCASVLEPVKHHDWQAHARIVQDGAAFARPLFLFAVPEPVTALAEVPDGPPTRFEWRRMAHRVARAEGPERIAPEWWLAPAGASRKTRDYYRVEDEAGRRFWLYRDGLYERGEEMPQWFIHGVFA